jgi:hypothetical protein
VKWSRLLVAALLAGAGVLGPAAPASAHGLGGLSPTNYQTVIVSVSPRVDGVTMNVIDVGQRLELTNTTAHDVVVPGYDGEAYLRVGPRGVYQNRRSPATYLNRSFSITGAPPKYTDAGAPPDWVRLSGADHVSWHDHRAHFMGRSDPPAVQRDRGSEHRIDTFRIVLRTASGPVTVTGQIRWVPGPPVWPFLAGAGLVAAAVVLLARGNRWAEVFGVTLAVLTAAELVHVVGLWGGSTAASLTKLGQSAYSLAGVLLGLLALGWLRRRGGDPAVPLVLLAAIFLCVAGGLADVTTLGHSQLPTTLPGTLARALVAVTLGGGAGLAVAAALRLRPAPHGRRDRARARGTAPAPG